MSATLASIQTHGFHIIDTAITIASDITIGTGSKLYFCGGFFINPTGTPITLSGENITIIAAPYHIFVGQFEFTHDEENSWTMDRAYPQWFGAADCTKKVDEAWDLITGGNIAGGKTKLDTITDASTAINAAIKLKRRGEVLIPRGYYRLAHSVNILPGIVLRGEGCVDQRDKVSGTILFPWASEQLNYKSLIKNEDIPQQSRVVNLSEFDFPLPPNDVKWFGNGYSPTTRIGFMLTACIGNSCSLIYSKVGEDSENNPIYSDYPESITYSLATGNRTVGTEISKLTLVDLMSLGSGIDNELEQATLRAILIAGGVRISDVRVYGLSQFVSSTNSEYEDLHFIEHCLFTGPVMLNNESEQTLVALYPKKIYAYDLSGYGDALVFHGNHASTYCEKIGALHLCHCNGGSVTGNILNSDVLIEKCCGIDFADNHLEYGSQLTIASSSVAVRSNYVWRGTRPAITIRRHEDDAYAHCHSCVELTDNQLFWHGQLTAGEPQAAQSIYRYDVRTDGYASITISNTFRKTTRKGPIDGSYFGIQMEWMEMRHQYRNPDYPGANNPENIPRLLPAEFSEGASLKSDFEEFNRVSHIASIGCHIQGRNVTPMPSTINRARFGYHRDPLMTSDLLILLYEEAVDTRNGWKDYLDAQVDYTAWLFADYKRRLLIHDSPVRLDWNVREGSLHNRAHTSANKNLRLLIGQGEYSNFNVPSGPYWLLIQRLSTYIDYEENMANLMSALLPISNSTQLWDDGRYLSGYEWDTIVEEGAESSVNFIAPEVNDNVERVQYHGENVECLFSTAPSISAGQPQLVGEWLDGDVIKWVANGNMVVYCKSDGSWHKYQ